MTLGLGRLRAPALFMCFGLVLAGCLDRPEAVHSGALPIEFLAFQPGDGLNDAERDVYKAIMQARAALGLPEIPLSASLTLTAGRHAADFAENIADGPGLEPGTNIHSWSDAPYPADHSKARVMWHAPARLGTPYPTAGYEIAANGTRYKDPAKVVEAWLQSPDHGPVIRNEGIWTRKTWRAIGVGRASGSDPFYDPIWYVWFGDAPDPAGPPVSE